MGIDPSVWCFRWVKPMLTALKIHNYAIVSQLELHFELGMTAFTGETGAGKSIMIDALMLALGGRGDASVIRMGATHCDIAATFCFEPQATLNEWLSVHAIDTEENELVLRRVLYLEGRSKSFINGIPFPLQKIKELSEMLVDIHGQHQHQSLLKHATHRQQLDQYANHPALLASVEQCYQQVVRIQAELTAYEQPQHTREHRDLLRYQIEELDELALQEDEINALHAEHQRLHHAREYLEKAQQMTQLLQHDSAFNIRDALQEVVQIIATLPGDHRHIKNLQELMNSAMIQCDEAVDEITAFVSDVSLDPERLQWIETRMSTIHHVARKFHVDVHQLTTHFVLLQSQWQNLSDHEKNHDELKKQYEHRLQAYLDAASQLRESRRVCAVHLAQDIEKTIRQLGMPHSRLSLEITPIEGLHAHGMDKVEYKVSINPGTLLDSLSKVVSGGELSRISLGIHMITAQRGSTPTLLFDEVDVGIGGKTAALVGQWLRQLGEKLQLFCVTHQPQVASCAHHHFMVEKDTHDNQTYSRVQALAPDARVQEIARMLGGLNITQQTRSHAQELLEASEAMPI